MSAMRYSRLAASACFRAAVIVHWENRRHRAAEAILRGVVEREALAAGVAEPATPNPITSSSA
jgi:hypothetical protein